MCSFGAMQPLQIIIIIKWDTGRCVVTLRELPGMFDEKLNGVTALYASNIPGDCVCVLDDAKVQNVCVHVRCGKLTKLHTIECASEWQKATALHALAVVCSASLTTRMESRRQQNANAASLSIPFTARPEFYSDT